MNRIDLCHDVLSGLPSQHQYLVGVSAGRDSVALLHWLVNAGYKNLNVCHLDHRLRGRASDADARFVRNLVANYRKQIAGQADLSCRKKTLPDTKLEIGSCNVRALAKRRKMSIETAAREARYKFFATVAKRRKCYTIFLAHHADDLVETFLINLFRGAGNAGLSGMRSIATRRIDDVDLTIVRPFLGVWGKEIDDYVRKHRLKFREDASNRNLKPLRNRIRRQVIPYLEKKMERNIRAGVWRAANVAAEEELWMDRQLTRELNGELSVRRLRDLPVALQRRQILTWLRNQNIPNVGFDLVENVRHLIARDTRAAKTNLPQDRHVRRRAGKLFVE